MIDKEVKQGNDLMNEIEKEGRKNIFKYVDRVHDKLFNLNIIIIATYAALLGLNKLTGNEFIIIPAFNLCLLLVVDYSFADMSRKEARIKQRTINEINKTYRNVSILSLIPLISTLGIMALFLIRVASVLK